MRKLAVLALTALLVTGLGGLVYAQTPPAYAKQEVNVTVEAAYAISVSPDTLLFTVTPLTCVTDSHSRLTYSLNKLGAKGTQITVYADIPSWPTWLKLKLYPTDLPLDDKSPYAPPNPPLDLSTVVGSANATEFIVVGATGADRRATLNYEACVTWDVPAGTSATVGVIYTIQDAP